MVDSRPDQINNQRTDVRGERVHSSDDSKVPKSSGTLTEDISRVQSAFHIFDTNKQYTTKDMITFSNLVFSNKTANSVGQQFDFTQWDLVNVTGIRTPIFNNTGSTLNPLDVVFGNGGIGGNNYTTVAKSQADSTVNFNVLGIVAETILNGETGFVVKEGIIFNVNTAAIAGGFGGRVVFLSETIPGGIQTARPTALPVRVGHILEFSATGSFLVHIGLLDVSINLTAFDDTVVTFGGINTAQAIPFNNNGVVSGITHSETVNTEEFTFISPGVYTIRIISQFQKVSGGGTDTLSLYLQIKPLAGSFANIPFSTRKVSVNASGVVLQSAMEVKIMAAVGDVLKVMGQVTATTLELPSFAASGVAPNDIPETSSVAISITRE